MKKINVSQQWINGRYEFVAVFDDYDGAPDSSNRYEVGYGLTHEEAVQDLQECVMEA